ncbi:MAG: response regulator [Gammaproteobacteria bacterium]|nr:MAG: response regulator [Gammaproteobacteria bacterium]
MTISAIVVDDEQHARQGLIAALRVHPGITIIAECGNGQEAVQAVHVLRPDLMFLDIQMPRLDGFDVLELLGRETPVVVFVTAHDEYAIRAFDSNALDYLLKPINPARLARTVDRIEQRLQQDERDRYVGITTGRQELQAPLRRILVRDGGDVHVIPTDEVIYFEAADDYVAIHLPDRTLIKQDRLQRLADLVDPGCFCRVHRGYLINLSQLKGIESETKDQRVAVLKTGQRLPISRSGYNRLRSALQSSR